MPRRARVVIPQTPHHVTQRGNFQENVFENEKDFRTYLYLMDEYSQKNSLIVNAYCLMSNHVHFIVTPSNESGLAEVFKNVHMRYSQYKNLERKKSGQLWQGRFYSCVLDFGHLIRAVRYVEMNPVRANIVQNPWEYIWSSTRQHMGFELTPIIKTDFQSMCHVIGLRPENWREYLLDHDEEMIQKIRMSTKKGVAVGSEEFVADLEKSLGVVLRAPKVGRPRKGGKSVRP